MTQQGEKYHRSNQRTKLYLRMPNSLLNSSILAIYGLWKSSEIVLLTNVTNRSQIYIIQLFKNAVRLLLDNFRVVGFLLFGRIRMDSSHFYLRFDSILIRQQFILKVLLKSEVLTKRTEQLSADRRNVAYTIKYNLYL